MDPEDVVLGPDGEEYCAVCYPEEEGNPDDEDETYTVPAFSAPKPVKKERKRVARVRKITKTVQDDEGIARPKAFARAPTRVDREAAEHGDRQRVARVRTITRTVQDDEGIARPRPLASASNARAPTRVDREAAEHGDRSDPDADAGPSHPYGFGPMGRFFRRRG